MQNINKSMKVYCSCPSDVGVSVDLTNSTWLLILKDPFLLVYYTYKYCPRVTCALLCCVYVCLKIDKAREPQFSTLTIRITSAAQKYTVWASQAPHLITYSFPSVSASVKSFCLSIGDWKNHVRYVEREGEREYTLMQTLWFSLKILCGNNME